MEASLSLSLAFSPLPTTWHPFLASYFAIASTSPPLSIISPIPPSHHSPEPGLMFLDQASSLQQYWGHHRYSHWVSRWLGPCPAVRLSLLSRPPNHRILCKPWPKLQLIVAFLGFLSRVVVPGFKKWPRFWLLCFPWERHLLGADTGVASASFWILGPKAVF